MTGRSWTRFVDPPVRRQLEPAADDGAPADHDASASPTTASSSPCSALRSTEPRSAAPTSRSSTASSASSRTSRRGRHRCTRGTSPTTTRPVNEATQAAYYEQALALAFCQPTVDGVLLFLSRDERVAARLAVGRPLRRRHAEVEQGPCHGGARPDDRRVDHALPRSRAARPRDVPPLRHALGREARRLPRQLPLRPRLPLLGAPRERRDALDEARRRAGRAEVGELVQADLGTRRLEAGQLPLHDPARPPVNPSGTDASAGPALHAASRPPASVAVLGAPDAHERRTRTRRATTTSAKASRAAREPVADRQTDRDDGEDDRRRRRACDSSPSTPRGRRAARARRRKRKNAIARKNAICRIPPDRRDDRLEREHDDDQRDERDDPEPAGEPAGCDPRASLTTPT